MLIMSQAVQVIISSLGSFPFCHFACTPHHLQLYQP